MYSQTSIIRTSIIRNLDYPDGDSTYIFTYLEQHVLKFKLVGCSILLFLVLLPGAMASIKHKRVVRTI